MLTSKIDQLRLNLQTLEFTLFLSYGSNQQRIPISNDSAMAMLTEFKFIPSVVLEIEVDNDKKYTYYIPFTSKG